MPKFCKHCGTPVTRSGSTFCSNCGKSLIEQQTSSSGDTSGPHLVIQEPGKAAITEALHKPRLTIGRDPSNDITLSHQAVSRKHARLEMQGSTYVIFDLNSANGTTVNGHTIKESSLKDGDIIRIGDLRGNSVGLTFRSKVNVRPHASTIRLKDLNLDSLTTFTIGRDPSNQIPLAHPTISRRHAQVQRSGQGHIIRDLNSSNGTFINKEPLRGSHLLQTHDLIQIGPFKLIYDHAGFFQYNPDGNYQLDAKNLVRQVTVKGNPLVILNNINLSIYPREFVVLVGGSGAGKSTLMKALSGISPVQKGQVLLNDDDLYKNFASYKNIIGYVPQDDIIHYQLTVGSALKYAARLRMPDASAAEIKTRIKEVLSQVELTAHVNKTIGRLSGGQRKRVSIAVELLSEPGLFFLDEPTSGLDPGLEKKMMNDMRILADEGRTIVMVTHATTNIKLCSHVAFMAHSRLVYFGPPHEAGAFFGEEDFADIYTQLSEPKDAEIWAQKYLNSPQYQTYVHERLNDDTQTPRPVNDAPQKVKRKDSFWHQYKVLTQRYFELIRNDPISLFTLLVIMPLIGLLIAIMVGQNDLVGKTAQPIRDTIQQEIREKREDAENRPSPDEGEEDEEDAEIENKQFEATHIVVDDAQLLLFMLALAVNLLGIFAAAFEIVKEEAIYQRERMVNLRIMPYLLSKITVLGFFALIQAASLLAIVWAIKVTYPTEGIFLPAVLEMYVTLFLATLTSIGLGLIISALVRSAGTIIYVILLVLFVQILFAGAIFKVPTWAEGVSYLTTTRWTLEALGATTDMNTLSRQSVGCTEFAKEEQRNVIKQMGEDSIYCEEGQTELRPSFTFHVNYFSTDDNGVILADQTNHLLIRWGILIGFFIIFIGITYFIQKRKDVI